MSTFDENTVHKRLIPHRHCHLTICLVLSVAWCLAGSCQEVPTESPLIVNGQAVSPGLALELGVVEEGQVVTVNVSLRNTSATPVKILRVNTTCGCTVADVEPMELGSEQEEHIDVSFDSAGKSGQVMQSVIITYEHEGESVALTIPIRGYVRMQPSYYIREGIDFGSVRSDSSPSSNSSSRSIQI